MGPVFNLIAAALGVIVLYGVFRLRRGWLRRGADGERVETEDALKHLYHCRESGAGGSIESIAGALSLSCDSAAALANRLEQSALVHYERGGLELTAEGERYALRVIRSHRLWEQYLAEETGIEQRQWHARADRAEHELTPEQADALSARMGHPVFDPHGDPIPTAEGSVRQPRGQPLNTVSAGNLVRVTHIEDEPESTYRALLAEHLQPGVLLSVEESTSEGVVFRTGFAQRSRLTPLVAASVTVQTLDSPGPEPIEWERLSALADGQESLVTDLSPACRGVERRRLLDLGLVPGTTVRAEFRSPAGDPVAYRVRGALIALRKQQADLIHVTPVARGSRAEAVGGVTAGQLRSNGLPSPGDGDDEPSTGDHRAASAGDPS
jgi:DtxR family transcriptional regulator, Mn-dependent transcriptional regulator